jgi:hypothetical protein
MIPKKYASFCETNSIPLPEQPSFYVMLGEFNKRKSGGKVWEREAYIRLIDRIIQLEDFLRPIYREQNNPEYLGTLVAGTRLILAHEKQLEQLGYPLIDKEKLVYQREALAHYLRNMENPQSSEVMRRLSSSETPQRRKDDLLRKLIEIADSSKDALKNWTGCALRAKKVLGDKPYRYAA